MKNFYTHNPFDRHGTHLAVLRHVMAGLVMSPELSHLQHIYGVEVWRSLDWLPEKYRVQLNVSDRLHLTQSLIGLFDSQIASGKRYDKALMGRLKANATFYDSHSTDDSSATQVAVDLIDVLRPNQSVDQLIEQVTSDYQKELLSAWRSV